MTYNVTTFYVIIFHEMIFRRDISSHEFSCREISCRDFLWCDIVPRSLTSWRFLRLKLGLFDSAFFVLCLLDLVEVESDWRDSVLFELSGFSLVLLGWIGLVYVGIILLGLGRYGFIWFSIRFIRKIVLRLKIRIVLFKPV